ncbi:hypothetical protein CMO93_03215 [Candidatus Woesearchaeota archaeon]|mgnify:CR=1 FL=1|nr:hypothetical protein [Candidatus Woesearchaeota archaeon]|tara:strand:- start:4304 stop:4639 length:336 start_codon:yes stop_codon:yes gene_type:complete
MLGEHIIGVIEINDGDILTSEEKLRDLVLKACKLCGLNVVGEKYHVFNNPKGITYCFILSQSHFIIHSWPEKSKLLFDIFTCNIDRNPEEYVEALADQLNGKITSLKRIKI